MHLEKNSSNKNKSNVPKKGLSTEIKILLRSKF